MGPGALGTCLPSSLLAQRNNEEERWLARQRKLRQEKADRQYQVSEFRQQVLEQHLDIGRPDLPDRLGHTCAHVTVTHPQRRTHTQSHLFVRF